MRTDIPVCNKCCMCLPMRYGLIVWGCLRLILAGIALVYNSFVIKGFIQKLQSGKRKVAITDVVIVCLALIIVIADIILGILFIIGCYKKNTKLIRKYYHHNLFLLAILVPLCVYMFGIYLIDTIEDSKMPALDRTLYVITDFVALFSYVAMQVYAILLIRSQIIKLKKGCDYRFENRGTEAEIPLNVVSSNGGKMT